MWLRYTDCSAASSPVEGAAWCCCCRLALHDAVSKVSLQLQQQQSATISNMAALLKPGMRVMTTSLSSTVAAALIQAHKQALAAAARADSEEPVLPAEVSKGSRSNGSDSQEPVDKYIDELLLQALPVASFACMAVGDNQLLWY